MQNKRIISLLPAATEIVCALGLQESLVGRSHECDYPIEIANLPICSDAKFLSGNDSAKIDAQVKEVLTDALSIYKIDKELIKSLNPNVIITQNQCEVCAVSEKDVQDALSELTDANVDLISLEPNTLSDILREIKETAVKLGVEKEGNQLIEDLEERIDIVKHKLKYFPEKPKVAIIEWLSPIMVAGNWIPELVNIAGGKSVLAENGKHSPYIEWQQLYDENPEVIIVAPCGFSINRTLQEIDLLINLPGWRDLAAIKNNRVYIADGNAYFNRSGPRIVDTIEMLAEMITPKYFAFGYEGEGWIKFIS
ncbi:cobalamin-binding protein [Pedobacter sp. SD-b]|uniref:Cobalamin-binding protein n=1 Tax=Pedobacter segetis TaxID=2793069 RepID=A0ABS1BH08_9SPHI|nr:cobalamin-binding protein [Pedobacter segetis]MBK0381519.1 cobalamin-binding protein [Pedobacter segetis]